MAVQSAPGDEDRSGESPDDDLQRARETAVRALAERERTVLEMREVLERRGLDAQADEVIAWLEELGDLDDGAYARGFAEDKRELKGWGAHRIVEALCRRGVERGLAEAAATGGTDGELERAVGLLIERGESLDADRERARALGFLARRGYDPETAHEAIREAERAGLARTSP